MSAVFRGMLHRRTTGARELMTLRSNEPEQSERQLDAQPKILAIIAEMIMA